MYELKIILKQEFTLCYFFWNMIKLSRDSKQMMDGSLSPKQIIKK